MSATALDAAVGLLRARDPLPPEVAIIAGSGLAGLAELVTDPRPLAFRDIPGWPVGAVAGHAGQLLRGTLSGRPVALALGRAHLYEGFSPAEVTFGVRVLAALGVRTLIVTNAAGGLNPDYAPGDVMVIRDQLFLPGLIGLNPLVGAPDPAVGARFPVLRGAYDADLADLAARCLAEAGLRVQHGVYAMQVGPAFETPAEARFLLGAGADAVGMSTAPEVVVARQAGLRVLGLSLITNRVPTTQPATGEEVPAELHDEVLAVGAAAAERLAMAVARVVGEMGAV